MKKAVLFFVVFVAATPCRATTGTLDDGDPLHAGPTMRARIELPLDCNGMYFSDQIWNTDFDLGVRFIDINSISINWSGAITAELVQPCAEAGPPQASKGKFIARLRLKDWDDDISQTYLAAGTATYPEAERFETTIDLWPAFYTSDDILVRFQDESLTLAEKTALLASFGGGTIIKCYSIVPGLCLVALPEGTTVLEVVAVLNASREIEYAQPNHYLYMTSAGPWTPFMLGRGIVQIEFHKSYRSLDLCTIEEPRGELYRASLIFEGTIVRDDPGDPQTRRVPEQYDTIQHALDESNSGDTIIVADGIYTGPGNRDLNFWGKAVTLRSKNGPELCIIDCNAASSDRHRAFRFYFDEGPDSVVDGFTITNGYAAYFSSGDIIRKSGGGAISCEMASPTIRNCRIVRNRADAGYGYGGAIYCLGSSPRIIDTVIKGNVASYGAALYAVGGDVEAPDGIPRDPSPSVVVLENCTITANSALRNGGALSCTSATLQMANGIITGNRAANNGAAVHCWDAEILIADGTIANNRAPAGKDILYCAGSSLTVSNSILWGLEARDLRAVNLASRAKHVSQFPPYDVNIPSTGHFGYTNIIGGETSVQADANSAIYWGAGNIDADPCFADAGYWDPNGTPDDANDDFWVDGDFHLKSQAGRWDANEGRWTTDEVTSPCIDAGDPMSPIGLEPFPNGGIINMGAYGGTSEASKSYFGKPPCETIVAGDVNGDCEVDFEDFRLMALHWLEAR